ncbi:hypothetical protein B0H14DRAFT_2642619 [Mycena olivaceomarginata]|nr:hypothetical protein B0H14DRAFT_2642619 [Mycena olivaceomarginata]
MVMNLLLATKASRALPCPEDEDLAYHSNFELTSMAFMFLVWSLIGQDVTLPFDDSKLSTLAQVTESSTQSSERLSWLFTRFSMAMLHVGMWMHNLPCIRYTSGILCFTFRWSRGTMLPKPSYLAVITIPTASPYLTMEVPFRQELGTGFTFGQLFLNHQVVGLLRVFGMERLDIVAFNRSSGACRVIKTDIFYDHKLGAFLDDSLYVVKHRDDSSNVYNCPSYLLPYNDPEGETHVDAAGLIGAVTATPTRGAALTTIHYINVDNEVLPRALNMRFWSLTDGDTPLSHRLYPKYSLNIRGMIATFRTGSSRPRYLIANSDVLVLVLVSYDDNLDLVLVQYDPSTLSSSICQLEIPPPFDLTSVSSIALDDHRGAVMLVDEKGVLHSISYVRSWGSDEAPRT